ncbi:MAG: TrlF family AAA-like ATPase [Filifactoraceae bacterium]
MGIAKWWRIDFHTHTPASRCFKKSKEILEGSEDIKEDEAINWLTKAKESKLDAVVITDHNSVKWINYIRTAKHALEKEGEKFPEIFPGVELSVDTTKIHILVVFDKDISEENLNSFMSKCNIMNKDFGDTNKYITEDDLIKAIKSFKNDHKENLLIIPAHYDKEKGAGKELRDEDVLQTFIRRLEINAIEIRDIGGYEKVQDHIKRKVLPNVATIVGSDNPDSKKGHSANGIGNKYTWVKMSELSLEGIRQSFLDPESRITKVMEISDIEGNPNQMEHNYISGIHIKKLKHIKDINIRFAPNLNCIVGPRGSGKSTIIEALKVMLEESSINETNILSKTYDNNSKLDLYYNFGDNSRYRIGTEGRKNNLKLEVDSEYEKNLDTPPKFNATIFGQKEIYNLVEDEGNIDKNDSSPILNQIDKNIINDKIDIENNIINKTSEIETIVKDLANSRIKLRNLPKAKSEAETTFNKLEKFRVTGVLEKKERLDNLEKQFDTMRAAAKEIYDNKNQLVSSLGNSLLKYNELCINREEILVDKLDKVIINEIEYIKANIDEFNKSIDDNFRNISTYILNSELKLEIEKAKKDYALILDENKEIDVAKYKEIVKEDERNRDNVRKLQDELEYIEINKNKLEEKIDEYIVELNTLTKKREEVIEGINSRAENIILSIKGLSHGERWIKEIRKDLGKKDSYESQFKMLYDNILPDGELNIENYKKWLKFLITTETGDIREVVEEINDQRFIDIWIGKYKTGTLNSLFKIKLEDKVSINIVNGSQELNITEGSPGQKSASILAFILSQGNDPLIIDQPEDDLDNSLIIKLVVDNIRKQKLNRQIIIVTHNPNIPVLGDAEGIIMLDRDKNGDVSLKYGKKTGCIEEKMIKNGICDIMEGGLEAFKKRENKYKNLN